MQKHLTKLTVRYAETDRMGVVYYANYLIWFEVARTEYLKARGISYKDLEEQKKLHLMVVESNCRHLNPVTYDDEVLIESWISEIKNASLTFKYTVRSQERNIAEGKTVHVFTTSNGKPTKIPQELRKIIM